MKKIITLVLILILAFAGFKYWEKSHNKLEVIPTQTSVNKNSPDDNNVSKSKKTLPCLDAAINLLALIEIYKQDSKMCGQQKRFNLFFNSPLIVTSYGVSQKCLVENMAMSGVTKAEAEKFSDAYVTENITKIKAADLNKNLTSTCSTLSAVFTKYGF